MTSFWEVQARVADSKLSLSVDSEQQVVKLGTSVDMGFCRAKKKVTLPAKLQLYSVALTLAILLCPCY